MGFGREMLSAGDAFDRELKDKQKPEIEEAYKSIEAKLKYNYDLPPERLMPGQEDYERYMCRTNVIDGFTKEVKMFAEIARPKEHTSNQLNGWVTELENVNTRTRDGMRTPQDMETIRSYVTLIVEICKSIKMDTDA